MNIAYLLNAPVTIALLVANIALSVWGFRSPRLIDATLFHVRRIMRERQYQRMITSGFLHGDPAHLFMNMLSLFFVGPYLEIMVGSAGFAGIYFASLLAGSLWTLMEHFRNPNYMALGASGAISGVLSAFSMFAPFAMFFGFIPAIVYTGLYIAWSAYAQNRVHNNIGHAAHLGGALMGIVMVCIFWPEAIRAMWAQWLAFVQR